MNMIIKIFLTIAFFILLTAVFYMFVILLPLLILYGCSKFVDFFIEHRRK